MEVMILVVRDVWLFILVVEFEEKNIECDQQIKIIIICLIIRFIVYEIVVVINCV